MIENLLMTIILGLVVIVVSALPLHLAVGMLGGRSSILRAFIVMIVTAVGTIIVNFFLPVWGIFVSWFLLIWVFRESFRLKWFKAILAWILWIVFIFLFSLLLGVFGLSFLTFNLFL
jgi:hypothetical protein